MLLYVFTQTFEGRVVGVTDDDTIKVLGLNNELRTYRLANIDAPETKGQAFGQAAKAHLSEKVFDKTVTMEGNDVKDHYGRYLGTIKIKNRNINLEMVTEGYAWCYRQYCKDRSYYIAEEHARDRQLGLWTQAAIPPWEFRSSSKSVHTSPSSSGKSKPKKKK